MNLQIDKEFQQIAPALSNEEREQLEENLVSEGCREPLVSWNGVLVDGHNRYEICNRRDIKFEVISQDFTDREHVGLWIRLNQLGRRNLRDDQRAILAVEAATVLSEIRKSEQRTAAANVRWQVEDTEAPVCEGANVASPHSEPKERVRAEVAKRTQVSEYQMRKAKRVTDQRPELAARVRSGDITLSEADKEIRLETRAAKIESISAENKPLPNAVGKFPVLYADPPWRYEHIVSESRAIENQYPTMTLDDICAMNVSEITTDDCILFLWATSPKLDEAMRVIREWGFTYRTCAVWDKEKIGMGYYFRQQHELLLVAAKGSLPTPLPADRPSSVVREARQGHSAKPERFYEIIEAMYPTLSKIELFARVKRDGWQSWGNQS